MRLKAASVASSSDKGASPLVRNARALLLAAGVLAVLAVPLPDILFFDGIVEPADAWEIHVEKPGIVEMARPVGPVAKGDPVLRLSPAAAKLELAQAEAWVRELEQELAGLRAGYGEVKVRRLDALVASRTRMRDLLVRQLREIRSLADKGLATPADRTRLEDAVAFANAELGVANAQRDAGLRMGEEADVAAVEARLRGRRAELEQAKATLRACEIVSPLDGLILELPLEAGAFVQPGKALGLIARPGAVLVQLKAPEETLGSLPLGASLSVTSGIIPGTQFRGTVVAIRSVLDEVETAGLLKRSAQVTLRVEAELPVGASARARLDRGHKPLAVRAATSILRWVDVQF